MTAVIVEAAPRAGATPAGLNPAQLEVWDRLEAARIALAERAPLDPDYLAGEAYYERLNRLNGDN
jgi:hypothetical protein